MAISFANADQIESIRSSDTFPSECCFLVASGRLTLAHSKEIQTFLVKTVRDYDHIVVDLSFVSDIDFFGLQLLLALKTSCDVQCKTVYFYDPNLLVSDLISFLHLENNITQNITGSSCPG